MAASRRTLARTARWLIQIGMVGLIAYFGLRHQLVEGAAPLDSFCPFGAVETLPALLGGFGFIGKIGSSNLVLLGSLTLVTLGLGASFCGWLCPFGAIQDGLGALRRRFIGKAYLIPERVHNVLKHTRWLVLALVVWMSWRALGLWFADYDPFRAMFHFKFESWVAVALVAGTLVGGLLVERFWCLYLCPLGAVVGGLGTLGLTKVRRAEESCTDCALCSRACPSRIEIHTRQAVSDQHCTMCTECVDACPVPGTLALSTGRQGESLRPIAVGVTTLVLFFVLIWTGWAMGWWRTGAGCASCTAQLTPAEVLGYNVEIPDAVAAGDASGVPQVTYRLGGR